MDSEKFKITYYTTAFITGLVFVFALVSWLKWPLIAGLIFGTCLFIQFMYISKKVLDTWAKAKRKEYSFDQIQKIRPGFFSFERKTKTDIQESL